MGVRFHSTQSLADFQSLIARIYALPDDRLYSIWDLLAQQQRFTMRSLKGIRKSDPQKIKDNLLIASSWAMSVANRLHIDVDSELWKRFPGVCSYCTKKPCACKALKPNKRTKVRATKATKPPSLYQYQRLFSDIYPVNSRTMADAGVHLAEEMGEVSEAIHNYLGKHQEKIFEEISLELADYFSCVFGLANSANINMSEELAAFFDNGCHACHKAPCQCSFHFVSNFRT